MSRSRTLIVSVVCAVLVSLGASEAADAHSLDFRAAKARAHKLADRQGARENLVGWDLSGPFRLDAHRLVWAWYGELPDGRACVAQLVVRFRSRSSRRTIGYFRNRTCD